MSLMPPRRDNLLRDTAVRRAVREAIDESGKPLPLVAAEMEKLLGERVSHHALKAFISESTEEILNRAGDVQVKRKMRFPTAWIDALCIVTGSDRLYRLAMGARFRKIVEQHEQGSGLTAGLTETARELKVLLAEMRKHRKAGKRGKRGK